MGRSLRFSLAFQVSLFLLAVLSPRSSQARYCPSVQVGRNNAKAIAQCKELLASAQQPNWGSPSVRRIQSYTGQNQPDPQMNSSCDTHFTPPAEWKTYAESDFAQRLVKYSLEGVRVSGKRGKNCCLHFVKQALLDSCFMTCRSDEKWASEFEGDLQQMGFVDILPEVLASGSLKNAPKGSVIVYKNTETPPPPRVKKGRKRKSPKTPPPPGSPGHIEIKDGDCSSTYSSFYTSKKGEPRSGSETPFDGAFRGNDREIVGIYIKPDGRVKEIMCEGEKN